MSGGMVPRASRCRVAGSRHLGWLNSGGGFMVGWLSRFVNNARPGVNQAPPEGGDRALRNGAPGRPGWRRAIAATVPVAALGLLGFSLMAAPAASAASVTSPTGMVTVSVPPPVVAGLVSTYT